MKRWAIAIGINQYHFFQPLSFAQQDAQAIRNFLVNEAGLAPEQCLLLTDFSPPIWGKPTYPNREIIQNWLNLLCQQYIQPGDSLWVFFSGYGVCSQGQDYWVPIDGNPTNLAVTAIPVEEVFCRLKAVAAETILIMLDMNRSQSSLPGEPIGIQTAQLASDLGLPTILSCQPGQFSQEILALGHGLFTVGLLEQLRSQPSTTLAQLEQYLGNRLPELSRHNHHPVQRSLVISPIENLHQPVLPLADLPGQNSNRLPYPGTIVRQQLVGGVLLNSRMNWNEVSIHPTLNSSLESATSVGGGSMTPSEMGSASTVTALESNVMSNQTSPQSRDDSQWGAKPELAFSSATFLDNLQDSLPTDPNYPPPSVPSVNYSSVDQSQGNPSQLSEELSVPLAPPDDAPDGTEATELMDGRSRLFWSGVTAASFLLIAGVCLRNWASLQGPQVSTQKSPAVMVPHRSPGSEPATASLRASEIQPSTIAQLPPGTTNAIVAKPTSSPVLDSSQAVKDSNPAVSQPVTSPTSANSSFINSQFPSLASSTSSNAIQPGIVSTQHLGTSIQNQTPTVTGKKISSNFSHLDKAKAKVRKVVNSDQASPYWFAIQEASQIKPNEPDYEQAQQAIAKWSQSILDIANRRASRQKFDTAIMAAALIPQNQPAFSKAEQALDRWCPAMMTQPVRNRSQRRQAKAICEQV
ncbi:MAG: caspase family protein [Leptolyngbyaceae cyanobacterium HOT.MB2.61]|nr:caspase family protein [Leptolyngbyaceae cyanobacterium HOT.MB2.61]